jgi:PAS domain S-box-containing protein
MPEIAGPERKLSSGLIALKKIMEGTSDQTGEGFFRLLVKNLAEVLDVHGVWITEYIRDKNRLRALSFWLENHFVDGYEYDVPGTPCEPVLESESICHFPDNVITLFPSDPDLPPLGAVSYMGLALRDENNNVMGHLALLDKKPMSEIPEAFAIFRIFASRAAAEMRRLHYEQKLIDSEAKLNRLVNAASEALIEVNEHLDVIQANNSAFKTFKTKEEKLTGMPIMKLFDNESFRKITRVISELHQRHEPRAYTFPEPLICLMAGGDIFNAEITISTYFIGGKQYHALFIKNIEARMRASKQLKLVSTEADMLREKINARNFSNIIGESHALMEALEAVRQVAPMESTVLIRGETGTGKELFARAIHQFSPRKEKPLVTLNCAALPSELVESELFGHIKGAFTGAIQSREGRFSLADGGTIFLDEIGELPLSLQSKLLRVLQEGEFEPVGSSSTTRVNVRVIAATNRNLEEEVDKGKFRQDLYYRLNVFPIEIPPLRERGNDIILLAEAFLEKFARMAGIPLPTLDISGKERLLAYQWPGNVRELQNIIERCVITSRSGRLNLDSLLPFPAEAPGTMPPDDRIMTEKEIIEFERRNIIRALDKTGWKISGNDGAASLLKIPSTTLSSRIIKLGITRSLIRAETRPGGTLVQGKLTDAGD